MKIHGAIVALVIVLSPLAATAGPIVDLPETNGYGTFLDTATGRVWLDLGTYPDMRVADMVVAAESLGFTFATTADVAQLLGNLPLDSQNPGLWNSYAEIMGVNSNNLIWGVLNDGRQPYGDSATHSFWSEWQIRRDQLYLTDHDTQLGIWAYRNAQPAPECNSLALLALGLAAIRLARRRNNARTVR